MFEGAKASRRVSIQSENVLAVLSAESKPLGLLQALYHSAAPLAHTGVLKTDIEH